MPREIIVISGDFGSGKTTLARRLARQSYARGERAVVVMAEPGPHALDSVLLQLEGLECVRVGDCEKLTIRDFAAQALAVDAPRVIVELFGAWTPAGARSAFANADRAFYLHVWNAQSAESVDTECARAGGAGIVLLNKLDTRVESEVVALIARVRAALNPAAVVPTVESTLTLGELETLHGACVLVAEAESADAAELNLQITWTLPEADFARTAVDLLVNDPPQGTLRIKGIIRIVAEAEPYSVQVTGRSGSFRKYYTSAPSPRILMIARIVSERDE